MRRPERLLVFCSSKCDRTSYAIPPEEGTRTANPSSFAVQLGSAEATRDYTPCIKTTLCSNTRKSSTKSSLEQQHIQANANTRMDMQILRAQHRTIASTTKQIVWCSVSRFPELDSLMDTNKHHADAHAQTYALMRVA